MCDFWSEPTVAQRVAQKAPCGATVPGLVPVATRKNLYLHPYHFSMDEGAKYGQQGRWPSNVQVKIHFPSVVFRGYESEKEAIEIKYPRALHGKDIPIFSTEFIDGHTKSVMCQAVFALLDFLDLRSNLAIIWVSENDFKHMFSRSIENHVLCFNW